MWATMSTAQRASAAQRLKVLLKFDDVGTAPAVTRAAADAGLSLNRWYEMHSQWREMRSLSSIGISAAMPRVRKLPLHNDLQRLVVGVVDANPEGSVRQLALALGEILDRELGTCLIQRPSYNTLRKFAEDEQRRRARESAPGNELVLDCCACALPHAEALFVAFLAIDKGSHAILGAALGDAADSRRGYALAARDALRRIVQEPLDRLPWADSLQRSEVVLGLDADSWIAVRDEISAAGIVPQLQPATSARRFGMYVRRLIGDRIGRVKFMPGKTGKFDAHTLPTTDDVARLTVEIDFYNTNLIGGRSGDERRIPTPQLVATLKYLAG